MEIAEGRELAAKAVEAGNWIICARHSIPPLGEWQEDPDGICGQTKDCSGIKQKGDQLLFCEYDGEAETYTGIAPTVYTQGIVKRLRVLMANELPDNLTFSNTFNAVGFSKLKSFPKGVEVFGSVALTRCSALKRIEGPIDIKGSLELRECKSLVSLPDNQKVPGGLYLYRCESLKSLPAGLEVEHFLELIGCISLRTLPDDLIVTGSIYLNDCPDFESVPFDVAKRVENSASWIFPRKDQGRKFVIK